MAFVQSRHYPALVLLLALLLCAAVYLPGLSGPWIFDDYTNIIHNSYLRIASLDGSSLYNAAFSIDSGPLRRPISVMSFALNYYFADGLKTTTPFKITNLVIHLLNTLLVFWLVALILLRVRKQSKTRTRRSQTQRNTAYLLAACAALIWSIHPLQLTSILYVVQRMTEFATMFTLLGLIGYLYGREQMLAGNMEKGLWFATGGILGGGTLGIFSKENAALLPLFVILFEFFLYHDKSPWRRWRKLSVRQKRIIWTSAALVTLATILYVAILMLPRYESREFTMSERLYTEARVLFVYISLLFVPDISRLGHQHDDIDISTSLFAPWTTLPSVIGITLLIVVGIRLRKRNPLLGLGILWFFTGHLMESSIIPLEISHEHRNYLPSLGFALAIASVLGSNTRTTVNRRLIWAGFAIITLAYAGTTYIRATQWSDYNSFYRYETAHHPQSARTQIGYSILLEAQKRYPEAESAVRKAMTLDPHETGFAIELLILDMRQKKEPKPEEYAEVIRRLRNEKVTATTILTMDRVNDCMNTWCSTLMPHLEQWIETILEKPDAPDPGYFEYRLGRIKAFQHKYLEALNLFQKAHDADPHFLHPLFEQINIFLKLGQIDNAEYVLVRLRLANANSRYPRDRELAAVEADIKRLRKQPNQP